MSTVANVASNHCHCLFIRYLELETECHKVHIWFKRYSSFRISDSENNWQTIKCVKVTLRSLYSEIYPPHRDNLYQQTGSGPSSGRAGLLENIFPVDKLWHIPVFYLLSVARSRCSTVPWTRQLLQTIWRPERTSHTNVTNLGFAGT